MSGDYAAVTKNPQNLSDLTTTYFIHYMFMRMVRWLHVDKVLSWESRLIGQCCLAVLALD